MIVDTKFDHNYNDCDDDCDDHENSDDKSNVDDYRRRQGWRWLEEEQDLKTLQSTE